MSQLGLISPDFRGHIFAPPSLYAKVCKAFPKRAVHADMYVNDGGFLFARRNGRFLRVESDGNVYSHEWEDFPSLTYQRTIAKRFE